jgi:zinc protease
MLLASSAWSAEPAPAVATDVTDVTQVRFTVEKYKLANGLTVLLQPDNSVPTIAYHTWFRVGSKNEEVGFTGIAHLFEHMMFKGSKRYDGKQYDLLLQGNGAAFNAFTTHDYTGYYINMPSSKLELVMDMESDRMVNLQLNQPNLDSEREVVKEERRMRVDNNPAGVLTEGIFDTVFKVNPYRWPVIGYMHDIDAISLQKAQQFYRTYYAPNNAVLVIAGDFNPTQAKRLIEKYYGALAAQPIPELKVQTEPEQKGQRESTIHRRFQNILWSLAFPIPEVGSQDFFALDLISNILGHGSSSRLYKKLVYQTQLASRASASTFGMQKPGIFEILVSLKGDADMQKVQEAVFNQIWKLRNQLVDDKELLKAKTQAMKDFVDGLKTSQGRAESLAFNEVIFGNYENLFSDLQRYNAVTKEQIKDVATKYLNQWQRNIVRLQPPGEAKTAQATPAKPSAPESKEN